MRKISWLEDSLFKTRTRLGKSVSSEARVVSKNEAIKIFLSLKDRFSSEKLTLLENLVLSFNKTFNPNISPFNPNDGFYVVDFEKLEKGIKVLLRGQNLYFSTFCFLEYILREVYDAYVRPANGHFYLFCGSIIVGTGRLYEKERCIKVKIGEFLPYGKFEKHEQILVKFWQKNFLITNLIFCPSYVVERLIPKIKEKKEEYSTLLITRTKILLKALNKS
ncbi:MAG: hypothetical protein QXG39_06815 [Candidatus Aenigmatarchaeota archaeon]